jgi:hypothetical protein
MDKLKQFVNTLNSKSKNTSSYGISKPTVQNTAVGGMSVAPKMTTVPTGNSSATSPVVTKPIVNTTTNLPPVASQYLDTLYKPTQNAYDTVTGARTAYGESQGLPNMLGGKPVNDKTNIPTPVTPPTAPKNPYQEYLDSFNKRQSNELLRNRQREDELRKNEIGQLERGQQYQLGEEERLSNRSLADLAIAKAPTLDLYNQYEEQNKPIEVGGVLYKKEADGQYTPLTGTGAGAEQFTLGKDQIRYDAQGNVIASGVSGGVGGSGTYTAGTDPTADAWVKYVQNGGKITDVPNEYQSIVAQGTTTQPKPQSEIGQQVVTTISDLLSSPAFDSIFGPIDQFLGGTLGPQAILAKNKYNQLKGLLSLDNIKYLKGTGAISDAEQRLLANAASAIGRNLYSEQAKQELIKLRDGLTNIQGESSGGSTGGGGLYDF